MHIPDRMHIAGRWVEAGDGTTMEIIDPATEQVVAHVPVATPADVDAALSAAQDGFTQWRTIDAWSRSAVLRRIAAWLIDHRAQVAAVMTEEQGKPLAQAEAEINATADQFDWYADEARRIYGRVVEGHSTANRILVRREPIGPVAAFAPSNFPLLLPARKIAPALAAGCSVVLKPAETTPRTAYLLALAAAEAGLPAGVLNVVTGDPARISAQLCESPVIRKISLTGSVPVGRQILEMAARGIKQVSMELGGHAPVLVLEDADPELVAQVTAAGKFRNGGQVCIAASRFFLHESVEETFAKAFVATTAALKVGDGRREGVDVGPLESKRRVTSTEQLVANAVDHGAKVAHGGHRPPGLDRGFWFEPTVLRGVDTSMSVMHEEPFGPIAPITSYGTLDEAIADANATPFGLAGFVFTRDLRRAFEVAEALEVGMVGVNSLTIATAEAPFGGVKESGFGREGGTEGVDAYTNVKYINMAL